MKLLLRSLGLLSALLVSCASQRNYASIPTGQFHGSLDIRWIGPNRFLYVPNGDDPFRFERANGEVILPQAMYTDGGSTVSILRSNPHFSPWGYGPAFVIHDWVFFSHSQGYPGHDELDFDEASVVLAEAMKTIMESHSESLPPNAMVLQLYRQTTSGKLAQKAIWMRPWYGDLPHPAKATETPSIAFDRELPFHAERRDKLLFQKIEDLKETRVAEERFGTNLP